MTVHIRTKTIVESNANLVPKDDILWTDLMNASLVSLGDIKNLKLAKMLCAQIVLQVSINTTLERTAV